MTSSRQQVAQFIHQLQRDPRRATPTRTGNRGRPVRVLWPVAAGSKVCRESAEMNSQEVLFWRAAKLFAELSISASIVSAVRISNLRTLRISLVVSSGVRC